MKRSMSFGREPMSKFLLLALVLLGWGTPSSAQWSPEFAPSSGAGLFGGLLGGSVNAVASFDDGVGGSALYVAGDFKYAGDCVAANIARWDGSHWSAVAGGIDGEVHALAVFDDGTGEALYATGDFDTAGGVPAANIARFDGAGWSALGSGIEPQVGSFPQGGFALAAFDDGTGTAMYVGGNFEDAGGVPVSHIAKWDGESWSSVGAGVSTPVSTGAYVTALAVFDDGAGPDLYLGGFFDDAGGVAVNNVARWDGSGYSKLGIGVSNTVRDFELFGSSLFAVGDFGFSGGKNVQHVAEWNGSNWLFVGTGLPGGPAHSAVAFDDGSGPALFVGGSFDTAGGNPVDGLARWDGSAWTNVGGVVNGASLGTVDAAGSVDLGDGSGAKLFIGGTFTRAGVGGGNEVEVLDIASWDGTAWVGLGEPGAEGLDDRVEAWAVHDDGSGAALYAGGRFLAAGPIPTNHVARWSGAGWEPLGSGVDDRVRALAAFDDGSGAGEELYAGGDFLNAGGSSANRIAKWDGSSWQPLGTGLDGAVIAMIAHDDGSGPALFVGGNFGDAGGVSASNVAKWNGTSWSALGSGTSHAVDSFGEFGSSLVVGGAFTQAGGADASHVALWDGEFWSTLGTGVSFGVLAIETFDPGTGESLYAAGSSGGVARWNGSAWESVLSASLNGPVRAMAAVDQGAGPELYIAGDFTDVGGQPSRIARVAGSALVDLDGGVDHQVHALMAFDDEEVTGEALYVGGLFTQAGDMDSIHVARWGKHCGCDLESYCTAGTTTNGCNALVSGLGIPSRSSLDGFGLTISGVEGEKQGLLFWGTSPNAAPWGLGSSFLCIAPPTKRTPTQASGGTAGQCDGELTLDFNAWMASNPTKAPPAGTAVHVQGWFRDPPAPKGTSLSDGLRFVVCP